LFCIISITFLVCIVFCIITTVGVQLGKCILFGILFVALLKVLKLRPYRRHLIIEANSSKVGKNPDSAPNKDIEL
jgi:hypothetical protein